MNKNQILLTTLCFFSLVAFALNIGITQNQLISKQNKLNVFRSFNLTNSLFNYASLQKKAAEEMWYNRNRDVLPDTILHLINNGSVDVFPWNYAIIPINKLNWAPRPSIHSYAIYTSWLDLQNANHYASSNAAKFIIWEIGEKNTNMKSIDNRYLLNDAPQTIVSIFQSYDLMFRDSCYLLYQKRHLPVNTNSKTVSTLSSQYNTWIKIPKAEAGSFVRAKINIKKSLLGQLKSMLYVGQTFIIIYRTADKTEYFHKIIPANAVDGLWINPLILNPGKDIISKEITEIQIMCDKLAMVSPEFDIQFEKVVFQANKDIEERCFGMRKKQSTID